MRALLAILLTLPLCAQEAAKPEPKAVEAGQAQAGAAEQAKPGEAEQAKPQEAQPAAPAEEAAAAADQAAAAAENFSGTIDIGYRWVDFTGGSFDTYRSVVNLGEGPKLFGADFSFRPEKSRLFDRLDVRASNWGGDPYNTVYVSARKNGLYDFTGDYRNIIYFNFLPSFANPGREGGGIFLDQRSYDIHRRISDFQLDLFPGKRIIPFLAYGRNGNSGRGITTFVATSNEYPVTNVVRDSMDNYRGGVRLEMNRWHVTLEQGGTVLKDDQRVFTSDRNPGNRTTPFVGQQLFLSELQQAYGVRGTSIYSRVLATANLLPWANLHGMFLYSQPKNDVDYSQANAGQFVTNPLLFYSGQLNLFAATAKMPHTSANAGAELRPMRRLRIIESWLTDRLHTATFGLLTEQLFFTGGQQPLVRAPAAFGDRLVMNYNQQQVDAFFDITRMITLRGGHRYVWGDSTVPPSSLTPAGERGELRRHVGIAGLLFRTGSRFNANLEFEGGSSDRSYFRTSVHDYQRLRARARFQAIPSLALTADFLYFANEKPVPTIDYDFLSRYSTLGLVWIPGGGQRVSVVAEYTRATVRSDIGYLAPQDLTPERSFYRENSHAADALVDVALPSYRAGLTPRIAAGGALYRSSGSRPTSYYQPVGRLSLPLHRHVSWVTEWRWHGFAEPFYALEDFRTHLFTTGVRIGR